LKIKTIESLVGAEHLGSHIALPDVPVAQPANADEARELLAMASRDKLGLAILGNGNKLGWSCMVRQPDFAISTKRLSKIVEFEPGDGTITAQAGVSMADLERTVGEAGLALTPDVPRTHAATLGGTIATSAGGADRLSLGPGYLHVLGTRSLQLSGELTRSGGNLVKNVSGYDLHRLYCGSFGCLTMVLEASLRLAPKPEATIVMTRSFDDLKRALQVANDVLATRSAPRAVTIENQSVPECFSLHIVLSGRLAHLEYEMSLISPAIGEFEVAHGAEAEKLAKHLRDLEPDSRTSDVLHIGAMPSKLRATIGEVFSAIGAHTDTQLMIQPGIATMDLGTTSTSRETLFEVRRALQPLGASAVLRSKAPQTSDFIAEVHDSLRAQLMERLRHTYDPHKLLCTRPPLGGLQ
jgi:glycolate oxidase FAD binding subunit